MGQYELYICGRNRRRYWVRRGRMQRFRTGDRREKGCDREQVDVGGGGENEKDNPTKN